MIKGHGPSPGYAPASSLCPEFLAMASTSSFSAEDNISICERILDKFIYNIE